jgi:hypothetical protein
MYYNDIVKINGVTLFVEESVKEFVNVIVACENEEMFSGAYSTYEIKNNTTDILIKGREWSVQSNLSELITWIFNRSFSKGDTKRDLKYFSHLLQLLKSNKITRSNFGMLGEILFAYHLKLDKETIISWLSAKNGSFDFKQQDKFYEVKTTNCLGSDVVLNLSYNQATLLGSESVELFLVDMKGSMLEYSIEEITTYYESLELPEHLFFSIDDCLKILKDLDPFTFKIQSYSGSKLLLKLDDKIIGLKCKVKLNLKNDFISFP